MLVEYHKDTTQTADDILKIVRNRHPKWTSLTWQDAEDCIRCSEARYLGNITTTRYDKLDQPPADYPQQYMDLKVILGDEKRWRKVSFYFLVLVQWCTRRPGITNIWLMKYKVDHLYFYDREDHRNFDVVAYELAMERPFRIVEWPDDIPGDTLFEEGQQKMREILAKTFGP